MNASPADLIEDIADNVNRAADDERLPEVASAVKSRIPTKVRHAVYTLGVVLGLAATAGSILAASLDGQPAILTAGVAGVALAVSNLIAKSHIAD